MVNASDVLFPLLFADDSNVFINGKNPANLADIEMKCCQILYMIYSKTEQCTNIGHVNTNAYIFLYVKPPHLLKPSDSKV